MTEPSDLRRRLPLAGQPPETLFFAVIGGWGALLAVIYWFVSYDWPGTVLLIGLGAAGLIVALRLALTLRRRRATPDRPLLDEEGLLPTETIAPLAVGLGVALSALALVYGPGLVIAGLVPLLWGVAAWIADATAELDTLDRSRGEPRQAFRSRIGRARSGSSTTNANIARSPHRPRNR